MRLLECTPAGEIRLTDDLLGKDIPQYAILSHTWGDEEVTFKDLTEGTGKNKLGYSKIQFCKKQALIDGFQYFWVDTCCIDTTNSTELHEAIVSMFRWYKNAKICYVYLTDVSTSWSDAEDEPSLLHWKPTFRKSRWFTRGWTLQELIAPPSVKFFSKEGVQLGTKKSLEQSIHEITGIQLTALQNRSLSDFSISQRMAWMERRDTKREEDKAYALLGIFNVYIPIMYGEGEENAFRRLHEEIGKASNSEQTYHDMSQLLRCYTLSHESHKNENPQPCPGTCKWLIDSHEYQSLLQEGKSMALWISGNAGCGKSVLARFIVEQLKPSRDGLSRTVLFYFFKQGNKEQSNTTVALRSLLCQLLDQTTELWSHAERSFGVSAEQAYDSYDALYNALQSALKDRRCGDVFCVIDGVDQIFPAEKDIMFDLAKLCVNPGQSGPALSNNTFKLIFTVRQTRKVREAMSKVSDNGQITFRWLKGEDQAVTDMIKHDLELYVRAMVRELSDKFSVEKEAILIRQLVERADTNFLWVRLVLATMRDSPSLVGSDLERIINDSPRQMDGLYNSLLRSADISEKGRTILHMIVGSATPMTLSELRTAFTIATNRDNKYTTGIEEEPDIERAVQILCGPLVKVVDERVYLVHWTAKQCLLSVGLVDSRNPPWRPLNIHDCNEELAFGCIRYLAYHVPSGKSLSSPSTLPKFPLLNHASRYWPLYVRKLRKSQQREFITDARSLLDLKCVRSNNWFSHYWQAMRPWQPRPRTWTILMMASFLGLEAVVDDLLEDVLQRQSEIQSERQGRDGRTAIDLAAESGHVGVLSSLLRSRIFDLDFSGNFGHTALHDAAAHGHTEVVKTLSEARADLHAKTTHGETALHLAAHYGHTLTVESLLTVPSSGSTLGESHGPGWTAIHSAADAGDIDTLVILIKKMLPSSEVVNRVNDDGYTALHLAAHERLEPKRAPSRPNISIPLKIVSFTEALSLPAHPLELITTSRPRKAEAKMPHYRDVISVLVNHGADVNAKTPDGWTPLHFAAKYGGEDLVDRLLMEGADWRMRTTSGLSAYDYADLRGCTAITERLQNEANNI